MIKAFWGVFMLFVTFLIRSIGSFIRGRLCQLIVEA